MQQDQHLAKVCYSVNETQKMTGFGRTLLYGEMNAGRLPYVKIGTRRAIRRNDLEAWLASKLVGVAA